MNTIIDREGGREEKWREGEREKEREWERMNEGELAAGHLKSIQILVQTPGD